MIARLRKPLQWSFTTNARTQSANESTTQIHVTGAKSEKSTWPRRDWFRFCIWLVVLAGKYVFKTNHRWGTQQCKTKVIPDYFWHSWVPLYKQKGETMIILSCCNIKFSERTLKERHGNCKENQHFEVERTRRGSRRLFLSNHNSERDLLRCVTTQAGGRYATLIPSIDWL